MSDLKPCPFCGHKPMQFVQTGLVTCRNSWCSVNPECETAEGWNIRVDRRNDAIIEALAAISNMCIGNVAMGYPLDAESIGNLIYKATGLTNPELNELTKGE